MRTELKVILKLNKNNHSTPEFKIHSSFIEMPIHIHWGEPLDAYKQPLSSIMML